MRRFFQTTWYRPPKKRSRKSAFGSDVASVEEVKKLNKKIKQNEADEFAEFEKGFDEQLKQI